MESTTTLTTTTTTLDEWEGTEVFDVEFARELKSHPDIPKEDRLRLSRYLKKCENVNHVKVSYILGKKVRDILNVGRLCAEGGLGLQMFPRDQRAALAQRYYWDVDMVNAQPTLILQYCERKGLECGALKRYVECREEVLDEVVRQVGIERWEAKQRIVGLYFGGSSEGLTPFVVRDLAPEARRIIENVWKTNPETLKWLSKHPNHMGKGMSQVFQTEERKVLLAMVHALAKRGRSLDVLIHDGGLVRKKDGETEFPSRLLKEVEADIMTETGYHIRLAVKPMETTIERSAEDDYEVKKRQFEETGWKRHLYFKLRFPPMFIAIATETSLQGKPIEQLTKGELIQNEEDNFTSTGSVFIKKWLEDPTKKEYDRVEFAPGAAPNPHIYNLFQGLPAQAVPGDWSIFRTLLMLLVNHDDLGYEYVENWVARRVQRLDHKSQVCLIFQGRKGVGKDTYWNEIGKLFGTDYFHNTDRPEHTVFARFNSQVAKCLLIKFEEADFQTNKENESQLKGLITSTTAQIEKKGHPIITVASVVDVVMTTNQEVPIPMTDDERRFAAFKVSEEKRGDATFWSEVHTILKDPAPLQAYYHYLLNKPLGDWSPVPAYKTRYYKDLVGICAPYHARYFCEFIRMLGEEGQDEWVGLGSSHELMRAMTQKYPKFPWDNAKKFGMMMRDTYTDAGVIQREEGRLNNTYRMIPSDLRKFLEAKGWWD